jgi:hypothetical protein
VVFHGHAHRGQPVGATAAGVPVYNVALPLLRRCFPNQPPFRVVEVPAAETTGTGATLASAQSAPARPVAAAAP